MPCTQLAAAQTCLTNLQQQCLSTHPTFPLSASMQVHFSEALVKADLREASIEGDLSEASLKAHLSALQ